MSNLSISCCRSTNYGLWVLKCTELIRKRKGTLWELTNGILKFSSASFYYRDWSRNFQRVLEWTLCGVVWARSRFLGKTLHSDSASPYLGLWIKCFNQSVSQSINQSINQSIDRSIDQSVNQSKYIHVSEYSNLFYRFDLTGYLAAKIFLYMFVAKLSGDIAFTLVYIYSAELFPTTVR